MQRTGTLGLATASPASLGGKLGINPGEQAEKGGVLKEHMAHCEGLLA